MSYINSSNPFDMLDQPYTSTTLKPKQETEPSKKDAVAQTAKKTVAKLGHQVKISEHTHTLELIKKAEESLTTYKQTYLQTPELATASLKTLAQYEFIHPHLISAIQSGTPYKDFSLNTIRPEQANLLMRLKNADGITLFDQIDSKLNNLKTIVEKQRELYQASGPIQNIDSASKALDEQFQSANSIKFSTYPCPPHYSLEIVEIEQTTNQLELIKRNLVDKKDPKKTIELIKHLNQPLVLTPLCHLIWELDGRDDRGDINYGLHAIEKNPDRLLYIKNSSGKDIIAQIVDHLTMQKSHALKIHLLNTLKDILGNDPVNKESTREKLTLIKSSYQDFFGSICKKVWERDKHTEAAKKDGKYGENKIYENPQTLTTGSPSILDELITKLNTKAPQNLIEHIRKEDHHVTCAKRIENLSSKGKNLKIAMVSLELRGVLSEGGLGEAVLGMASALNSSGNKVTVIMPRFNNEILPEPICSKLTRASKIAENVHKISIGSGARALDVLMIEDEAFNVGKNDDGTNRSIYASKPLFIRFQQLAKEVCHDLFIKKEIDVIHLQDSQTALIPILFQHSIRADKKPTDIPPVVFTFHNNGYSAQCNLEEQNCLDAFDGLGLDRTPRNSFVEGIMRADAVTTVSSQFAHEAMFGGELERGVGHAVRQAAYQGRFFDVLNGIDSSNWNPKTNKTLEEWTCVETLDFEETLLPRIERNSADLERATTLDEANQIYLRWKEEDRETLEKAVLTEKKVIINLTFGKGDHPLYIAYKKELCKQQVANYLQKFELGTINPDQPLLLNIGRFDASQKGTAMIPLIMDLAKRNGAQLISIGVDGESCPDMQAIEAKAREHGSDGAIVIQDKRENGKIKWQVGHTTADGRQIPGFGPLLRAAADIGVFPSEFEPCGLVQGESFIMGCRALTTDTGGFHDTVFTEGERKNGWRFAREKSWKSEAQKEAICTVVPQAIEEVKEAIYSTNLQSKINFYEQSKKIMENAELMDWTKKHPSDSMTPVEKLQAVYAFALKKSRRDIEYFDLISKTK